MARIKNLGISLFLCWTQCICAQQIIPSLIPTPNASDLGRYGDTPVSYYTGKPDIIIPLHSINVRGLELPIALRYDPSGILINSLPGWLGHSWSLDAGGIITRVVNGWADEYKYPPQTISFPFYNYFQSYSRLKEEITNISVLKESLDRFSYDMAPDIFIFNFMGKTGRFFLGNDGQWRVMSDSNIDVVFNIDDDSNYISPFITMNPNYTKPQPKVIKGFTLRDENGYIYEFGGSNAIEYSHNLFKQRQQEEVESFKAQSWYLSKIKDKYGNILYEFTYERGKFIVQLYNNGYMNVEYGVRESIGTIHQYVMNSNTEYPYDGVLTSPVYMTSIHAANGEHIEFSTGLIEKETEELYPNFDTTYGPRVTGFDYLFYYYLQANDNRVTPYQAYNNKKNSHPFNSARLGALNEIMITHDYVENAQKQILFTYDYNSRMHLTDIFLKTSESGANAGSYHFNYKDFDKLPTNYLIRATDHWGFYNGMEFVGSNNSFSELYFWRQPNSIVAQYGMLKDIIYPTGGCSVFEFEQNDFSTCMTPNRQSMKDSVSICGGVRIKSITDYSSEAKSEILRKRTYSYHYPQTQKSSGELFAAPCYNWGIWYVNPIESSASGYEHLMQSTSIIPLSNSFGPHVGYSYVEETEADGSFTRYHYQNISSVKDERFLLDFSNHMPSPYDRYSERGYKRGRPLSIEYYDKDSNLKKSIRYTYRSDNLETDSTLTGNLTFAGHVIAYYRGGVYKLFCPKYDVVADTTTYYFDNANVTDIRTYNKTDVRLFIPYSYSHYTTIRRPLSECLHRNNQTFQKNFYYISDDSMSPDYGKMFDLRPASTVTYFNNTFINELRTTYFRTPNGLTIPESEIRINPDESVDTLVTYDSYTPTYALESYIERGKAKNHIIWGYNDTYQVVRSQGTETCPLAEGCSPFEIDLPSLLTYRQNNPQLHVTSYSHFPLNGVSSITKPNGNVSYYEYGNQNRLAVERDFEGHVVKRYNYNLVH